MRLGSLTVEAGWHERYSCPAQIEWTPDTDVDPASLILCDTAVNQAVPVQAQPTSKGKLELSWIIGYLAQHETRTYELQILDTKPGAEAGVQLIDKAPGQLEIHLGGTHFSTYNYGADVVRPYLYPVLANDSVGITRDWPMVTEAASDTTDHIHHRGIWTAHGEVTVAGCDEVVDNWGESSGHGWQIHQGFEQRASGLITGGFTQNLAWTNAEKQVNMTETRTMTFYNTQGPLRLFDYQVTLHASEGAVTLLDTKEAGLLSVRVATSMDAQNEAGGHIENGYGAHQEAETWGKRAPWCDYTGPIGDQTYGICLMDHPDNPRYPTHWHVRNYGLMTANCFGLHDFTGDPEQRWDLTIPADQSLTWRYRVLIHAGDVEKAAVREHYHGYVSPPAVVWNAG